MAPVDSGGGGGLTDAERYQFDRTGYLVLEDVLSEREVAELNRLVDEQSLPAPTSEPGSGRRFRRMLEWGEAFRDLLDYGRIPAVLRDVLGCERFRLDHYYGIYMEAGGETLGLHGGGTPHDPAEAFDFRDGKMYNGLTVVAWNLTDAGPDHGGFCAIPGSHKSNYECPDGVLRGVESAAEPDDLPQSVVVPEAPAGSVVVFTEALTHGTAPWVAEHQRRSVLYKYSPGHLSWAPSYPTQPDDGDLTARQERLFEPPSVGGRESFFGDVD
jgi:ectoine hydroxylase-related dioxygenase (phytanoyl-CoA dioxygenase family)